MNIIHSSISLLVVGQIMADTYYNIKEEGSVGNSKVDS